MFEGLVSLSNDINANVAATWIIDKDNNITTISDRDIYYSIWNGSGWGDLELVTNDVAVDVNPTLAYSQNNAISVWSQDTDGNITTRTDRELYYAVWNGNQWSTPTYLTDDSIEDTIPTIMFDKFNKVTLTWIKRNETGDRVYISTYNNGWSSPELVAESPTIYEMELSFDSENNAVIVWQGASSSGQDIFYTVRDNSNQLWCGEKQLTNDTSAEWQLSTTINSKDEIMSCYVKHNISIVNYTVIEGESDLCHLIHPIMLDLTLDSTDITFSDETAYPGDTITIDATIHNIGDLQANSVEVKFFDGSTGPQIGTTQTIPSLPAGQNATVSVTWNIPLLQQSHDIYVKVDPDDKLPETNEINNVAFASIVLPDLEIDESDVTFSYEQGSLRINATIHNSGVIAASNVAVELFDEGSNGTLIDATTITSLSPNSNETISTIWNTQGVGSGIHNISIIIDRMDGIREQNETNNIANLTLMILPDLTVNANNVSFSEMSEGNITIDARIRNIGISNAENITIEFFDGDPFENGTLIGSAIIDSLSVDSESIAEINWYATPGQHDIYVQIDPSNLIPELDKSNNLAFNPVIITPGADLMLNSPDIMFSDVNETGQVFISATIHNVGFADVPYTTVEFYNGIPNVSVTNPYVTNIPNSLGTEVVPLVSSEGYAIVNLSANWTPMENVIYNIYVKIDPKDNVHEFNESNNIRFNRYPPLLVTNLPNVELLYADPTVTGINVDSLSEIDETYKPEECTTPQSAYMIDSTGSGNFTLRFTDISGADSILVYKIDPSSTPPDQWILLDATTTADTVTFTMEVGDPPVVFCSGAQPTAASSSATGASIDTYRVDADVYATGSGFTTATVDIYVVHDRDWNNGDQIPSDVTGAVETASVANGDVGPVLVWHAPLMIGEYDIVIDANQDGFYNAATDGLDSGSPGFVVIDMPSVPVPALAPIGIIALVGLLCVIGMIRIRRRFS
jgi:subtilase family serine protease